MPSGGARAPPPLRGGETRLRHGPACALAVGGVRAGSGPGGGDRAFVYGVRGQRAKRDRPSICTSFRAACTGAVLSDRGADGGRAASLSDVRPVASPLRGVASSFPRTGSPSTAPRSSRRFVGREVPRPAPVLPATPPGSAALVRVRNVRVGLFVGSRSPRASDDVPRVLASSGLPIGQIFRQRFGNRLPVASRIFRTVIAHHALTSSRKGRCESQVPHRSALMSLIHGPAAEKCASLAPSWFSSGISTMPGIAQPHRAPDGCAPCRARRLPAMTRKRSARPAHGSPTIPRAGSSGPRLVRLPVAGVSRVATAQVRRRTGHRPAVDRANPPCHRPRRQSPGPGPGVRPAAQPVPHTATKPAGRSTAVRPGGEPPPAALLRRIPCAASQPCDVHAGPS
jgi:hypothetical protein